MTWNFKQIQQFARGFAKEGKRDNHEIAFVLSEWSAETGFGPLKAAYPTTFVDMPPENELPSGQVDRLWLDNGSGWQKFRDVLPTERIGKGDRKLVGGIESEVIIAGWKAKGIGVGYILAPSATIDQINMDRTAGIALIRVMVDSEAGANPLAPEEPFTTGQVSALSAWLNAHGVTNAEFAALFGVSAAELGDWLTSNPRWRFAEVTHEQFA